MAHNKGTSFLLIFVGGPNDDILIFIVSIHYFLLVIKTKDVLFSDDFIPI